MTIYLVHSHHMQFVCRRGVIRKIPNEVVAHCLLVNMELVGKSTAGRDVMQMHNVPNGDVESFTTRAVPASCS